MLNKSIEYKTQFLEYKTIIDKFCKSEIYEHSIEATFESLNDWSLFYTLDEVKQWFIQKKDVADITIEDIPINEMEHWKIDKTTGNISHTTKDFFSIHGIRITTNVREVTGGWDQPIIRQTGYDGGLLGMIRQRFNGVPHYLCEAKMEPGNYDKVQLSPTLQATFSNLKKSHNGRKPHFSDYFENTNKYNGIITLFDAWLSEDGGRLYLKRNRGILLEIPEGYEIEIPNDNFIWLSLYQIKAMLKENAWINSHIRGILAHV